MDASLLASVISDLIISFWFVSFDIKVNCGDWFELPDESLRDEVVVVTSKMEKKERKIITLFKYAFYKQQDKKNKIKFN